MAAANLTLVTPSDYILLEDGTYALPNTDDYLPIDGASCEDPKQGALEYNRNLLRHLKGITELESKESRYRRLFQKHANNRRVIKVLSVAAAFRNQFIDQNPALIAEASKQKSFSSIESDLFSNVPMDLLQIEGHNKISAGSQ